MHQSAEDERDLNLCSMPLDLTMYEAVHTVCPEACALKVYNLVALGACRLRWYGYWLTHSVAAGETRSDCAMLGYDLS